MGADGVPHARVSAFGEVIGDGGGVHPTTCGDTLAAAALDLSRREV